MRWAVCFAPLSHNRLAWGEKYYPGLHQAHACHSSACIEDVNFRTKRGLEKSRLLRLAGGDWIRQHQTLLLVGPTGTGKSWLACALDHMACRQGHTVRYLRLPRLLSEDLVHARADASYAKLMQTLAKTDLLILDDWGLAPLGDRERRAN